MKQIKKENSRETFGDFKGWVSNGIPLQSHAESDVCNKNRVLLQQQPLASKMLDKIYQCKEANLRKRTNGSKKKGKEVK